MPANRSSSPSGAQRPSTWADRTDSHAFELAEEPLFPAPIRLLLVSDLFLHRAGVRGLLEAAGIRVVAEASGCDEAVGLAVREQPDITVLDLDLRGDVFVCLSEILSSAPLSRIIALSDQARAADHLSLIERGATGLVLKTEPPGSLIQAIHKVNGGEVWLPRRTMAQILRRFAQRRRVEHAESAKIGSLSRREREIVAIVCEGLKNLAIADRLFVSEATVRNHLTSILAKLGVSDRFQLAVYAFRNGLVGQQGGRSLNGSDVTYVPGGAIDLVGEIKKASRGRLHQCASGQRMSRRLRHLGMMSEARRGLSCTESGYTRDNHAKTCMQQTIVA